MSHRAGSPPRSHYTALGAPLDTVDLPIGQLRHPAYNPRQISDRAFQDLQKSLATFQAVEPAVVNTHKGRENIIVGGNMRIRAAQALGWPSFPCVLVDLSPKRERELNIRLNANTGAWDYDIIANEFDTNELIAWGLDLGQLNAEPEDDDRKAKGKEVICPSCGETFKA